MDAHRIGYKGSCKGLVPFTITTRISDCILDRSVSLSLLKVPFRHSSEEPV